ncbi:MAG: hypothetical protein AB7P24_17845 [Nitrospira sp.]
MKQIIKTLVALSLLMGTLYVSTPVQATPPTPPVEIQLPKAEALKLLQPDKGTFIVPAQVKVHQDIEQITLSVRATTMDTLGRREGHGKGYPLKGLKKGDSQTVEVQIPAQDKNGLYRIEAALQIERQGRTGVVSKQVLIQVVEKGVQRLTTPLELRRTQVSENKQAFHEALARNPKDPDIRLLMDDLVPVSPDLAKTIKPYSGPVLKRAAAAGPPAVIKPYLRDKPKNGKVEDRSRSKKPNVAQVQPGPLIELRGQVVFEDWYTNTPCNPFDPNDPYYPCIPGPPPVSSGLPNATIWVIESVQGYDALIGTTVTDDNGNWSTFLGSTYEGSDVYYMVILDNDNFNVHDAAGNEYVMVSAIRTATGTVNFGQEAITINTEAAQVFSTINRGWNHIVTEGGQDPGLIAVQHPDFCLSSNGGVTSCWDPSAEVVRLEAGTNDAPDIILHEYGHGLMHYAFGHSIGGGTHSFSDYEQDYGLAFSEGWASAFALSVCPDGLFSGNEGPYEDSQEWPACAIQSDGYALQYDGYQWIEGFDFVHQNRRGDRHEGRVAAAITDFLDAPNDNNGGNENQGKNGHEDANVNDRISLATIYRDSMWGFDFGDFTSYYLQLRSNLASATQVLADDIMSYNWQIPPLTVPVPETLCVASKVAMAMSPEYAKVLDGLRTFRDKVMKPMVVGRQWMQSYYSHSPEMAILLIGDSESRKAAQVIVEHFSRIGQTLKEPEGSARLAKSQDPVLPPLVIESIKTISKVIQAKGSKELKQKLAEVRELLKPFEGLAVSQAAQKVSTMEKAGRGKDAPRVQPLKFAPGSQQVDWELIKKNVPKGEWPGTSDKRTGSHPVR